jgi:pilus assembly protein FimV
MLGTLGSNRLAELQRSRAFGWLAFSSALLVLLASGVAISRIGDDDGDSPVASAPTTGPAAGAEDGSGAGAAGSPGEAGTSGAEASGPAGATGASDANAATGGGSGTAKDSGGLTTGGTATAAGQRTSGGAGSLQGSSGTSGSTEGTSTGSGTSGSETSGSGSGDEAATDQPQGTGGTEDDGGQGSPPAPSEQPPEQDSRLIAASASAGEGAQGGVLAAGVDGTNLDVDLTLGRDQLVGNHPPSDGTGVSFGGRLLNPPSVSPAFPTVSG